jgi:hypothetical protein
MENIEEVEKALDLFQYQPILASLLLSQAVYWEEFEYLIKTRKDIRLVYENVVYLVINQNGVYKPYEPSRKEKYWCS